MNKRTNFGGKHFLISTCSLSRKNIFSTIFCNNPILCFMHTFPIELEYTIYCLSPDPFCYIVSWSFQTNVNQTEILKIEKFSCLECKLQLPMLQKNQCVKPFSISLYKKCKKWLVVQKKFNFFDVCYVTFGIPVLHSFCMQSMRNLAWLLDEHFFLSKDCAILV